jgi:hypothetical protein
MTPNVARVARPAVIALIWFAPSSSLSASAIGDAGAPNFYGDKSVVEIS